MTALTRTDRPTAEEERVRDSSFPQIFADRQNAAILRPGHGYRIHRGKSSSRLTECKLIKTARLLWFDDERTGIDRWNHRNDPMLPSSKPVQECR